MQKFHLNTKDEKRITNYEAKIKMENAFSLLPWWWSVEVKRYVRDLTNMLNA